MLLHNIREEDLDRLEELFAYLTPEGWKIPEWLELLRKTPRQNNGGLV